ncbi:MAG: trypsin-like peptidase domain-containing protein [Gemmataceae bacterium]
MAIDITCPHCRSSFRVADEILGKRVRCKSCQEPFVAREGRGKDEDDEPEERIQQTPAPRRAGAPASRRRDEDDEEEREPRSSRRNEDEEDDRRRRREDDEDDRDADRRRRRDRPRPVAKPAGMPMGLLLGGVAAALIVGVVGVVGAIFYFSSSPSIPPIQAGAGNPMMGGAGIVAAPPGVPGIVPPGNGAVPPPVIGVPPVGGVVPPPAQAAPPVVVGVPGPRLRYAWQGGPHVYAVNVEIEHDKYFETHRGNCIIRAQVAGAKPVENQGPRKATGTGFVVHANGYLITCAHVVEDAAKVEVALGGKTYQASVLALDHDHDLAVLQINARDLPTLTLADSDRAEVGMEVRALGFPLSSVLGDNIKATRGTISGINNRNNRKVFQIDAPINPGNSGGPLVSETGQVFGINNSKLSGAAVSNVGFAAPSNEAKRLLASKNITAVTGGWTAKLEGPVLVKNVSAATALITVTLGAAVEGDAYRLNCGGHLFKTERGKEGVIMMPGPPSFPAFPNPAQIEMDASGQIKKVTGGTPLPALLGELGQFLIEPVPADTREMWELTSTCTITEGSGGRFGGFRPRMPRFRPGGFGPPGFPGAPGGGDDDDPNAKKRQATERSTFTRTAPVGDIVNIHKHYELKCNPDGASPGFHLVGDSKIPFDMKQGFPRGVTFNGSLTVTSGNTVTKLPITLTYTLVEGPEREKILNPPPPPPPKPVTEEELPQLLADAKETDRAKGFKRREAIEKIAKVKVVEAKRGEVIATLTPILSENDDFVRRSVLKALGVWGTKEVVPAMLPLLDDKSLFVRMDVMEALSKMKDERGVEPIAKRLSVLSDRTYASNALKAYGSMAEKAVADQLASPEWTVRMEACRILKEIGTAKSTPALTKSTKDTNALVARFAREALQAAGARK